MNILVTGANGQLGNEMRILAKNSADKYIFTDVVNASEESIAMLKKLAGDDINTCTEHLDITNLDVAQRVKVQDIVTDNYEILNPKSNEVLVVNSTRASATAVDTEAAE